MLATNQTVRFKCVYGATNPTISQKAPRFDTEVFHQFIYLLCTSSLHSLVWIDQLLLGHMTPINPICPTWIPVHPTWQTTVWKVPRHSSPLCPIHNTSLLPNCISQCAGYEIVSQASTLLSLTRDHLQQFLYIAGGTISHCVEASLSVFPSLAMHSVWPQKRPSVACKPMNHELNASIEA